ncbi:Nut Family Member 1 [Manis pentadactyla]|nr:Nut Family Member 1 [Manis pentadactyla]
MTMTPGATLSHFSEFPFPPPAPGPPDQPPWEPPPQPPVPVAFSPGTPVMLSALPSPLLVTGDVGSGPSGAGAGKVIVKVKTEGGPAEPSQTQSFLLTQTALNWLTSDTPCRGPKDTPPQFVAASNVKTLLSTKAVGRIQEGLPGLPAQAPPPAAQLAPTVPREKAWLGPQAAEEGSPASAWPKLSLGDLCYTSKGVYENFRGWQSHKALARRHLPQSPDTEALSCFLIPVLRSLTRLKPTVTLEEGLSRAVWEWEHTSNYDRIIFYDMAEKFMEFEAEEEMQIQNTQLMNGSQGPPPATPLKLDPPGPLAPEVSQQPVYIPKTTAKARAPRRRQRKTVKPPAPKAPKEIPTEAVKEYADIMEGLVRSHLAAGESDGEQEKEEQQQEDGMYPDPGLLSYIDELCSQEAFVSKVEGVIHPRFLEDLLSPEQERDPLALIEELEQEEEFSLDELVQKRLLALEEEVAEAPPSCSGAQSDSSPSVFDEDEDGGGQLWPSPGPRVAGGTVRLGKPASPGKRARDVHGGQEQALDSLRGVHRDGHTLPAPSSWDLQLELAGPQRTQGPVGRERRGPGEVTNQISHQNDHLGGAASPGHSQVADRTSMALPLCWQKDPQLERVPSLDAGLAELVPVQGQAFEKQVLELQTGQQIVGLGVPPQGKEPLAVSQEGSSGAMWGDDRGPPMVQSYDPNTSSRAAGDGDRDGDGTSLCPGLGLSSEMDSVGLELPLQIEVIEKHNVECVIEHEGGCQALDSGSNISLGPGEATPPGAVGNSTTPCAGTDTTDAPEKKNSCSLSGPLRANSPALSPKENGEQSPETIWDPSDPWANGFSPLLSRIGASTLGASKETPLPACEGKVLILGTQDTSSFQTSPEGGNRGNSISPPLETTKHINKLDNKHVYGFQLGVSEDTCPPNLYSCDPQGEGREVSDLSKPKDLVPLPGNQEPSAPGNPKPTSPHQGLGSTFLSWGTRDALVLSKASPASETNSSADGAKGKEEQQEEEDEGLSTFAYLLASKLSLSQRPPLGPHPATGLPSTGRGVQRASHSHSAERRGLGQPPRPVAKSGKRALPGGPALTEEKHYVGAEAGVSGEKSQAPGGVQPSQPCKRQCDAYGTGRKKKQCRKWDHPVPPAKPSK